MKRNRVIAITTTALVVLVGCGGGGQADDDASSPGISTSTTEPAVGTAGPEQPAAAEETAAPQRPRETEDSGQPTSTPAGESASQPPAAPTGGGEAPTASPPPASPRPAEPATAGTYRYDTDGTIQVSNGPRRPLPKVTTLTIHAQDNRRQRSIRDLRDQDGGGSVTEQILEYAPEGVHLVYLKLQTSMAGVTETYEFRPARPALVVRTGATAGDTTTFTLEGDGVTINTTATVHRTEQIAVGGSQISALVLELRSELSGRLQGHQTAVSWIDPERSLAVKEDVDADVTQGAVRVRSRYIATVRRLEPH